MLTINEIFHSIQGESTHAGRPCVFVRLTACDLRCSWCDTPYAFHEGRKMSRRRGGRATSSRYGCPLVEITGGEPLLQEDVYPLMERLLERGRTVMLETGGHRSVDRACRRASSDRRRQVSRQRRSGEERLGEPRSAAPHDEVKFVVQDRADYEFARDVIARHALDRRVARRCCSRRCTACSSRGRCRSGCSPIALPVRLQLQLHKFIWAPRTRGACEVERAVVLLSGGLDSYTAAAIAQGGGLRALRADASATASATRARSRRRARSRARSASRGISSSTSTCARSADRRSSATVRSRRIASSRRPGIPSTYVPARNTIFLSLALGWAEVLGASDIVIGVNALDYSGYPDCRPEFIAAFERLAALATRPASRAAAPHPRAAPAARRRPTSSGAGSRSASTTA